MDTGGKIATGVLVPLAVGGAAVAAYFLVFRKKTSADTERELSEEIKRRQASWKNYAKELDDSAQELAEEKKQQEAAWKQQLKELNESRFYKPYNTGGKRRTHRRRR